jgi:23S rRNA pseudouridine1911/1915/1917 synthase
MKQLIKIPVQAAGERLDVALAGLTGRSRSQISKLFKEGLISINGEVVASKLLAEAGATVELIEQTAGVMPDAPDLKILYEDDDLLAVDKPADLAVHLSESGRPQATVAAFAAAHGVQDEDIERPGIIHRLDKDTSGILLIAKHPRSKAYLQDLFRDRKVHKTYTALVRGRLDQSEATVRLPIGRDRKRPTKRAVVPGGREATTHYRVLEQMNGSSLIEVELETGRTHQIRVHFAHIGHPVMGDTMYGGPDLGGAHRQFLHASRIEFTGPSGKLITITSKLPPDLQEVLKRAREAV